jgi:hypothetical protein
MGVPCMYLALGNFSNFNMPVYLLKHGWSDSGFCVARIEFLEARG